MILINSYLCNKQYQRFYENNNITQIQINMFFHDNEDLYKVV